MFETKAHSRLDVPYLDDDEFCWDQVSICLYAPIFILELADANSNSNLCQTSFLTASFHHIKHALHSSEVHLIDIRVMLPAHMTQRGGWSMEGLAEIWEGLEGTDGHSQTACVFITTNGNRYLQSALSDNESDLRDLTMRMDFKNVHAK